MIVCLNLQELISEKDTGERELTVVLQNADDTVKNTSLSGKQHIRKQCDSLKQR